MVRSLREIIDKLIDGVFEYETDKLLFDVQSIEAKITPKEVVEGRITIKSELGSRNQIILEKTE